MNFQNFQHLKVWRCFHSQANEFEYVFTTEEGLIIEIVYTKNEQIPYSVENYVDYNDVTGDSIDLSDNGYKLVAIEIIPINGYHNYQLILDDITQVTKVNEIHREY